MTFDPTRRGVVTGAGALALGLSAPWVARAQSYKPEYKISTVVGAPFPWGLGAERWAAIVKEKSGGKINMKVYPGASLVGGDQTKEFTAMRQGVIDMAVGSTINWSPQVAELNLFSLPFLMPDHKAIDAITTGDVGKKLFDIIAAKDVVPLAWGENGFRELSNSKRAVRKPDDLKGLKIRVVGSPLFNETFSALGANPTQMSWADAQPALSTGAVDGQENPLATILASKFYEVQEYTALTNHIYSVWAVLISKKFWDRLSPDEQKILADSAKEATAFERETIRAFDKKALDQLKAEGMEVTSLPEAEVAKLREKAEPVRAKFTKEFGEEAAKEMMARLEKGRAAK